MPTEFITISGYGKWRRVEKKKKKSVRIQWNPIHSLVHYQVLSSMVKTRAWKFFILWHGYLTHHPLRDCELVKFFFVKRPNLFAICNKTFSKWWEGWRTTWPVSDCTISYRPVLSSERSHYRKWKQILVTKERIRIKSGHGHQRGAPRTKTNWSTDWRPQGELQLQNTNE
jgi:hypothetical protein